MLSEYGEVHRMQRGDHDEQVKDLVKHKMCAEAADHINRRRRKDYAHNDLKKHFTGSRAQNAALETLEASVVTMWVLWTL